MDDQKITALTELTAPAAADLLPIVDDSEATAANKETKRQQHHCPHKYSKSL